MPSLDAKRSRLARRAVGAMLVAGGACLSPTAISAQPPLRFGAALALLGVALVLLGVFVGFGETSGPSLRQAPESGARQLLPPLLGVALPLTAALGVLRAAVQGVGLGPVATGAVATFSMLGVLLSGRWLLVRLHEARRPGRRRSSWNAWALVIAVLIQVPWLGSFGLIDPWETHYGEAAREMVVRRDWISLWWAQDGWFWSKPILNFWLEGISLLALGAELGADRVLAAVADGLSPRPEWALRLPVLLSALVGQATLHLGVRAHAGRRAAWLTSVVLITTPYWALLSRQSVADMHYVAPLTAAVGLLLIALRASEDRLVSSVRLNLLGRRCTLSLFHLAVAALLLSVVPQVLYLASRNFTFHWGPDLFGYAPHLDRVLRGSPGNCGLPGNAPCVADAVAGARQPQPLISALVWAVTLVLLLIGQWRERRVKRLAYLGAWWFGALSFMAKGAPGLVLLLFVFGAFVVVSGRYRELRQAELLSLFAVLASVAAPWFVQEATRHGAPFIERLFIHDMVKRAFGHVHDTNQGTDTSFRYYLWQLGYGLFPWTGLVAACSAMSASRWLGAFGARAAGGHSVSSSPGAHFGPSRATLAGVAWLWALGAFGMFSITGTKYHHYILPLVPPLAILTGLGLDELWRGSASARSTRHSRPHRFAWLRRLAPALSGSAGLWVWLGLLSLALWVLALPLSESFVGGSPLGEPQLALGAAALIATGGASQRSASGGGRLWPPALAGLAAAVVALCGRDLVLSPPSGPEGQLRLMHLFVYNYGRPWPETLDFRGELLAFTIAAAACGLGLGWRPLRRWALRAMLALSVVWAVWLANVYLVQLSPHWGQRELVEEYYRKRTGPEQPLVAYQLNWKGENFYTGNHIPAFVTSGQRFKRWIEEQRKAGVRTAYFITEHSRLRTLERELGKEQLVESLTDKSDNNKFALYRAQLKPLPAQREVDEAKP